MISRAPNYFVGLAFDNVTGDLNKTLERFIESVTESMKLRMIH